MMDFRPDPPSQHEVLGSAQRYRDAQNEFRAQADVLRQIAGQIGHSPIWAGVSAEHVSSTLRTIANATDGFASASGSVASTLEVLAYAVSPLIAQRQTVITQLKQQAKEPGLAATLVFSKLKGDLISLESRIQRCFEQASDDVRAAAAHAAAWGTNINVNPQAMRQAVGEEIGKAFASFAGGVVEGVSDTVTGTWNLATHPQSVVNLVRAFEADGPGTLKKMWDGIIDAETWQKDPARAMGKIAPGIIATILTAGGSGAVLAAGKATGKIEKAASAVDIADYARPSNFRSGVRDQVWVQNSDTKGIVRDPVTKRVMQKDQPWDMGHKEGYEFWKHQLSAQQRKIDRPQFLDEHNNPLHYRPELPGSNRSHRGEDPSDSYFGP